MTPEHIHLLINHIPIHGLVVSTLFLIVALLYRNRLFTGIAMAFVAVSGLSIPFVMASGEKAYEHYESDPQIKSLIGEAGLEMAETHYEHAETGAKATYLLLVVAIVGLGIWKFRPDWLFKIGWIVAVLCVICLILNAWIASSGGKIRRPDFRSSPPTAEVEEDDD